MIRIVTDSTASIPKDIAEENGIEVATMYVSRDGVEYEDATMDLDVFYRDIYDMVDNIPKSSQPSKGVFEAMFEEMAKAGDELLGIFMSAKMSGTVDCALQAARSVASHHVGFNFRIIDTSSNSFDEAWPVLAAASGRDAGCSLDQCCELVERSMCASRWLFTPESLRFLKAGGRIGTASALLGNLMKICPVLTVSDGETATFAKVRTQKKALATIANKLAADIADYGLKNLVVHYIGSAVEASRWAREVVEPIAARVVPVIPVSACIGVHVGPAIGIVYECEHALPGKLSFNPASLVYAS